MRVCYHGFRCGVGQRVVLEDQPTLTHADDIPVLQEERSRHTRFLASPREERPVLTAQVGELVAAFAAPEASMAATYRGVVHEDQIIVGIPADRERVGQMEGPLAGG